MNINPNKRYKKSCSIKNGNQIHYILDPNDPTVNHRVMIYAQSPAMNKNSNT